MKNSRKLIIAGAIAGIFGCVGDFAALYIFAQYYPGYSRLRDTMSALGASISPVSTAISTWWVILGLIFIFFGIGFNAAFSQKGKYGKIATWLIILYGAGEGIGSGVFRADHVAGGLTAIAIIHNIVGGIGVLAALMLPVIMQKIIPKKKLPGFHLFSKIILVTGILTLSVFILRFVLPETDSIVNFKGLWQRLFVLTIYVYMVRIAIMMISEQLRQRKNNS